jgi:hypothetical protein
MLQPFIREIGGKYYCTLCGNEAEESWPDHGYRRDYICRCEDALAWPEREARRRQVADKIRRLELIDELTRVNMRLGLGKSLKECTSPCSDVPSGEGMVSGLDVFTCRRCGKATPKIRECSVERKQGYCPECATDLLIPRHSLTASAT